MNYEDLTAIIPEGEGRHEILFKDFEGTEVERLFRRFFDAYAFENDEGETVFLEGLVIDGEMVEDEESETVSVTGILRNTFLGAVTLEDIEVHIFAVFALTEAETPRVSIRLNFEQPWTLVSALAEEGLGGLSGDLSGEAVKKLAFPVSSIELDSESFQFSIAVEPALALALETVPQYLQGVDVVEQFPTDGFPSFNTGLSLSLFQLSAGLDPLRLAALDMEVALSNGNGTWSTFGDFVVFRDLRAGFTLDDPLGTKALSAVVNGTAVVAGVAIEGQIELPSLSFACFLEEGARIEIKALLEELTGVPLPMSAVTCTAFLIEGVPEERTYSLEATIEDLLELDLGISTLRLETLSTAFTLVTPEQPGGQRSVSGWINGSVLFGEVPFAVTARLEEGASGWTFTGGLADEGTLTIETLFTNLSDTFGRVQLPPALAGLEVEELSVQFDTAEKNFFFNMSLHFPVDGKELMLSMNLEVTKTLRGYTKRFTGTTIIQEKLFLVEFGKSPTRSRLLARFEDTDGFELNPISLLDEVSSSHELSFGDDSKGLTQLKIHSIGFLMESVKVNTTVRKTYTFDGAASWTTNIPFTGDDHLIQIDAELLIKKVVNGGLSGNIRGQLSTDIAFFEHFPLTVVYDFSPNQRRLGFELPIGNILLKLDYETRTVSPGPPPRKQTILSLATGSANGSEEGLTFGDIISFLVGLIDPDTVYFQLDPPWDLLNEVNLSGFSLKVNMTTKAVTVSFASEISLGFMTITKLGLAYVPPKPGRPKGVNIVLEGSFLGSERTLAWDAVNDAPPAVPGKGNTVFDLRYLGIGQRVSLNPEDVAKLQDITSVMTLLRSSLTPLPPAKTRFNPLAVAAAEGREVIRFNADSGFLLGASLVLLGAFDLRIIFNDPLLYGLRIELSGPAAKQLKGLKFEILYRRVTDNIGVYHIDLTLPDALRYLQFGAVSITIPVIVLDIFTNGDFKIDVGFPWRNNFARSFGVQIFPFIGAAGIYFNKLSAETATGPYPPQISNGEFDPVIEFGFGLKIGLGKSFNKGVLRAELSVSIQGILEGVISWFNPDDAALSKEQYYRIKGSVALVGRIYGAVDFKVIRVDIEVIIRAAVLFVVEVYQPIPIMLIAEVSVKASVKILFITVKFSFHLEASFNFTVGKAQPTPWVLGARETATRSLQSRTAAFTIASRSLSAGTLAQQLAALEIEETPAPTPLSWQPVRVWEGSEKKVIDLFLQPAFTKDHEGVKGIAQLFIENAIDPGELDHENYAKAEDAADSDFDMLMHGLLSWALYAYYLPPAGEATGGSSFSLKEKDISREELGNLYDFFVEDREDPARPFNFEALIAFLAENYDFHISDAARLDIIKGQIGGTLFPMFPQLLMEIDGEEIDFDGDAFKLTKTDLNRYRAYFRDLQVQHGHTVESNGSSAGIILDNTDGAFTAATFVFLDYFALLIRTGIQSAIDYLEKEEREVIRQAELLSALNISGQYNHIAGMTSRFMLHGLRLPDDENRTSPVFVETGQQYAITLPGGKEEEASPSLIRLKKASGGDLSWLSFIEFVSPETPEEAPERKALNALDYRYPDPVVELIGKLYSETLGDTPPQPVPMTPYELVPRRFALTKEVSWSAKLSEGQALDERISELSAAGLFTLLEFPETLRTELSQSALELSLFGEKTLGGSMELERSSESNLVWATKMEVQLRLIPREAPSGEAASPVLDHSYALVGLKERDKDSLEDLFPRISGERPDYAVRLYLLHAPSKNAGEQDLEKTNGVLSSQADPRCYLVKSNLSTNTGQPDTDASDTYLAALEEGPGFVQLLWEGATVNTGGYYLYYEYLDEDGNYRSIPEHLFAGQTEATVTLLLVFTPTADTASDNRLERFHNCLLIDRARFREFESWSLETAPLERVLRIPPGNIGFQLERENPFFTEDKELDNLYQLLGYRLMGNESFAPKKDNQEGLPAGPRERSSESSRWIYEKVIPAHYFAKGSRLEAGTAPGLPPADQDPYAGTGSGENGKLALQFFWQDLYGNRLSEEVTANSIRQYPIRYFDQLIGINQWPSVIESFEFVPLSGREEEVALILRLYQDQRPYLPGSEQLFDEVMERIRVARATYQKVYYQIRQADIDFDIINSVLPQTALKADVSELVKTELRLFADQAYLYFAALEHLEPFRHKVTATNTFGSLSNAYQVPVAALAEENRDLAGIFSMNAATPLKIPVNYEIQPGDSLTGIASDMVLPPNRIQDWVAQTAAQNQDLVNLFIPGANIALGGTEYTVQNEDTLRTIAAQRGLSVAEVALENQDRSDVLRSGILLLTRLDYKIRGSDSLETIQQKVLSMEPFEQVNLRPADIAGANPAHRLNPGKAVRIPGRVLTGAEFPEQQLLDAAGSLRDIVTELNGSGSTDRVSVMDLVIANQGLHNLLEAGVPISLKGIVLNTMPFETFASLVSRFRATVGAEIGFAELSAAISDQTGLLKSGARLICPPFAAGIRAIYQREESGTLNYPADLIFPVWAKINMHRSMDYVDADLTASVPEIQAVSAYLSPLMTPDGPEAGSAAAAQTASLRPFARHFEEALPGLRLAAGTERSRHNPENPDSELQFERSLWAVHFEVPEEGINLNDIDLSTLQPKGIFYNIHEDRPLFFALAPLSNTLQLGTIAEYQYTPGTGISSTPDAPPVTEEKNYEGIDLNTLAQDFLENLEDFLSPDVMIPVLNKQGENLDSEAIIASLLENKNRLARAIRDRQLTTILDVAVADKRLQAAREGLYQRLLVDLADAYKLETLVQYQVDVKLPNGYSWPNGHAPRLSGKPVIEDITTSSNIDPNAIDITLSSGKLPIDEQSAFLTFSLDTKTPERFEDLELRLDYRITDLEYNIVDVQGIKNYQASSWLSFINPENSGDGEGTSPRENDPNFIGNVKIPIPLRTYPIPPSFILHRAEADPDSQKQLEKIREWQYAFTYEHPDTAQDTIEGSVSFNVRRSSQADVFLDKRVAAKLTEIVEKHKNTANLLLIGAKVVANGQEYTVKADDTLNSIAAALKMDLNTLVDAIDERDDLLNPAIKILDQNIKEGDSLITLARRLAPVRKDLFSALLNFKKLYPQLMADLKATLAAEGPSAEAGLSASLTTLQFLVDEVAVEWEKWEPEVLPRAISDEEAGYEINEVTTGSLKNMTIRLDETATVDDAVLLSFPQAALPGYSLQNAPQAIRYEKGNYLLLSRCSGNLYKWDILQADEAPAVFDLPEEIQVASALSPDAQWQARGYEDGEVRIWFLSPFDEEPARKISMGRPVKAMAFSPDSQWLALAGDTEIRIYRREAFASVQDPHFQTLITAESQISALAVSNGATKVLAGGHDGDLYYWDTADANPARLYDEQNRNHHPGRISSLVFSTTGYRAASASQDGNIYLWTLGSTLNASFLGDADNRVNDMALHPNGQTLAFGDWNGAVKVQLLPSEGTEGQPIQSPAILLARHEAPISSLTFNTSGDRLAAAAWDGKLLQWRKEESAFRRETDLDLKQVEGGRMIKYHFEKKSTAEAAMDPVFGESDIPDRTLILPDLDILRQQNAWAAIWLTRNKELIKDEAVRTNPVFEFQTPLVRFNNWATPFLVNDERWDISLLGGDGKTPHTRSLESHLKHLFQVLLPELFAESTSTEAPPFELRLNVRYSFTFAKGAGLNADLYSAIPVLLGLRLRLPVDDFEAYLSELAREVNQWFDQQQPFREKGASYIFGVSLFSKLDPDSRSSLPMLKMEHLELPLEYLEEG